MLAAGGAAGATAAALPLLVLLLALLALLSGTSLSCNRRTGVCKDEFTGNTMSQHSPSGELLFMHSNMHKWDMQLPDDFDTYYQRRWQLMLPGEAPAPK
jgi:hypothetical protein